jgi:hypothetical protein
LVSKNVRPTCIATNFDDLSELSATEVLGSLTNLPVAILEGAIDGCIDVVALEGCERQNGATADSWLVGGCGDDYVNCCRVADRAQSSDGGLTNERFSGFG